jgi:putative esterase
MIMSPNSRGNIKSIYFLPDAAPTASFTISIPTSSNEATAEPGVEPLGGGTDRTIPDTIGSSPRSTIVEPDPAETQTNDSRARQASETRPTRRAHSLARRIAAAALSTALVAGGPIDYGIQAPVGGLECPTAPTETANFAATYLSTNSDGVELFGIHARDNGCGSQTTRVLKPTNPAQGVAHNILLVLPVSPGPEGNTQYRDGLDTVRELDAQNKYNLTVVEPSFSIDPWYADNPLNPNLREETYITKYLVPWMKEKFAESGSAQIWLMGFSKSGIGAQDLLLKHPDLFSLAASWDFPATMTSAFEFGANSYQSYGTNANFVKNYELSPKFLRDHAGPFTKTPRLWTGGYDFFGPAVTAYNLLLTQSGIKYTAEKFTPAEHAWTSGWVPDALEALHEDSLALSKQ